MDQTPQDEEKQRRFEDLFPNPHHYANQSDYTRACRLHYQKFGRRFNMDDTYRVYALWLDARHSL